MKKLLFLFFILNISTLLSQYYHPFQNFDDDVDRIKGYSNFFGGDNGIMREDSNKLSEMEISKDDKQTRTGFGRSLKIKFGPITQWNMYIESFKRKWWKPNYGFDLTNLFPDYENMKFKGRRIDSIVFYFKLDAIKPLDVTFELHGISKNSKAAYSTTLQPRNEWQRISISMNPFGQIDSNAKFDYRSSQYFGIVITKSQTNLSLSGNLYLDDLYLVEANYKKPVFASESELLNYINEINFQHFWTAIDSTHSLGLDRHNWEDLISIDAVGFQLSSYVIAAKNNWINAEKIQKRVKQILKCLVDTCKHSKDTNQVKRNPLQYATINGIWAHFLDYKTLARKDTSTEYSIYSNALLLSGVIVCKNYFNQDQEIRALADSLLKISNWKFLYLPDSMVVYYGWSPEKSFTKNYSDYFTEELDLAFLLAISAPDSSHRLPKNPFYSNEYRKPLCLNNPGRPYIHSYPGSSFTYYFLQMYAKFNTVSNPNSKRFMNARNAILNDLENCKRLYSYLNYDKRIFGTSACEGPDSAGERPDHSKVPNYHAYGYDCKLSTDNNPNGTVSVYGGLAPVLFVPNESIELLKYYYYELDLLFEKTYGYNFWSPIWGFPDAFHLNPDKCTDKLVNYLKFNGPWLSIPRFGIDVGPMLMNIDSYISESNNKLSIRDLFSQDKSIKDKIEAFEIYVLNLENKEIKPQFQLHNNFPNPFNSGTTIRYYLDHNSQITGKIYNILGQEVRTLINEFQEMGSMSVFWDGKDNNDRYVGSGTYFFKISTDNIVKNLKMIFLK